MPTYQLVTYVKSNSNSTPWAVKTDGVQLTCACPGWTRRVQPDGTRTCRHVEGVQAQLTASHLTIAQAAEILSNEVLDPETQTIRRIGARGTTVMPDGRRVSAQARPAAVDPIHAEAVAIVSHWNYSDTRAQVATVEAAIRKFAGVPATVGLGVVTPTRPGWLGGGRAIILRE